MIRSLCFSFGLAALLGSLVSTAKAGEIIEGDTGDALITQGAVNNGAYNHLYDLYVGALYGTDSSAMVEAFALPYLAPGQQVTGATISFYLEQDNSTPNYSVQLYGLNRVSATSPAPLASDWYTGANDTANTLLTATFVTPQSATNRACAYSGSNLVSFVQNQYANATFSGLNLSNSRYIFFRLSPGGTQGGFNNYQFASARNPNRSYHPTLALTISNGISNIAGRLQFSFNLPQASITSAGVYNTSTGALIRTLWNNIQYQQGTNYGVWDGNDDSGKAVAAGSNYQIKLIFHNVQYVWEGMVGNTSASQSGANVYHSFSQIHDMAVSGSTAFYTVAYNEAQNPFNTFTVGSPQVPTGMNFGYGFSDLSSCIYYVASDATRSYWAKTYGGMNGTNTYVVAINNSNNTFYKFPNGTNPPSGANQSPAYISCVDFDATANQANPANGLAVQKSGNDLFVSHANLNLVRVFDKVQGTLLGSFTVLSPGRMATTANGDVWVISNAPTPVVQRYTFANGTATLDQTINGLSGPVGLGVSVDDSLLLVADGGNSHQIKAFSNSTGASLWAYGTPGGMAANGPDITTNTFNYNVQLSETSFSNEAFIAFQPDNTFWVEDGGNGRVLHYSISGNTVTYIEQIAFNAVSYRSTVDLTDATRVFNMFTEYSVNYALPLGGTNGSWTMAKNWAVGLPNDSTHCYFGSANGFSNVVTLSNGRTYAFLGNFITGAEDLFELPASGPARLTGYSFSNSARMYEDGTLRFNIGTSSSISCYSQPLTGFDAKNNPVWGSPALIASTALTAADPLPWDAYPMRTEITAAGVVVDFDGDKNATGYHLAGIPVGGTTWKWHASPSTSPTNSSFFPQDGRFDIGNGVQYAGNYAMAFGRNIIYGYNGEFWGGGQASQWVNFMDNGLMVGRFGVYETSGASGSIDGFAGNSFAPTLVHAANGKMYLYHNDESNHGGTIRWRIDGWDGITELNGTGSIGGTVSLSASTAGPSVAITSPPAGATYLNGNNVSLSAAAASSGASVTAVQFFDGSTSLGTVAAAPFTLNYSGLNMGSHVITAMATDSNGLSTTSASVTFTIGATGSSLAAPTPLSLSSGSLTSQSVTLNWLEPAGAGSSSSIGQIISFQCDSVGDSNALTAIAVAGAPSYAAANFNILGQQSSGGPILINPVNSVGATVPNIGLNSGMSVSGSNNSTQALSGTAAKLFSNGVQTFNAHSIAISNIPYALYDLVVYSLPPTIGSGTETAFVTVNDGANSTTVSQSFTSLPTNYNVSSVAFGSNSSVSNVNTIVIQGLTSPSFALQGGNITGFQIVQKTNNGGTPTSYNIQRALGTSGNFATVGTASGTALSFTDASGVSASTTYQYRIQAVNSFGTSAFSNTLSVTTPGASTATASPAPGPATFSAWQTKYFTADQLSQPSISSPTSDPYGSGVPNLLAYALQLNPSTAQPTSVPTAVNQDGHLTITYAVPSSITDISYIVEVSSDMTTWNSGSNYTQVISSVAGVNGNIVTVQDTLPTTTQKHFMRLRVTQLP